MDIFIESTRLRTGTDWTEGPRSRIHPQTQFSKSKGPILSLVRTRSAEHSRILIHALSHSIPESHILVGQSGCESLTGQATADDLRRKSHLVSCQTCRDNPSQYTPLSVAGGLCSLCPSVTWTYCHTCCMCDQTATRPHVIEVILDDVGNTVEAHVALREGHVA